MKTRREYLKYNYNLADSDTVLIDLKFVDPISYITVEIGNQNSPTGAIDHEIHDDIPVIEVVDGSEVITSLSMKEWIAANAYRDKLMPYQALNENPNAVQNEKVIIPFGREKLDPEYYLDSRRYSNPQLRIQSAFVTTAGAGFVTGAGSLTVIAHVMESGFKGQKGYISYKEIKSFTSAVSGDEDVNLPKKCPIKSLNVMALKTTVTPQEILTKWKLDIDTGKFVPFEMYTPDIADIVYREKGLLKQRKHIYSKNSDTALADLYDIRQADIRSNAGVCFGNVDGIDGEQVSTSLYDMSAPATPAVVATEQDNVLYVQGLAPFGVLQWEFGDEMDEKTWLDVSSNESAILYLTQAVAAADVKVFLEREVG